MPEAAPPAGVCVPFVNTQSPKTFESKIYAKKLIFFTLQIKHAHSKWNINNKHFMFFRAEFWCMTFPRNAFIIYGFVGRAGNASDVDYFTIMTIFIFKKNAFIFLTVCSSGRIIKKKKNIMLQHFITFQSSNYDHHHVAGQNLVVNV